ncbi:hypothetical protein KOR42_49340 [Thalassoglobus neptunius]|uniref:Uncharacterized protein n=1 Tax=Thalassoglobus neptunius TaxID=1938619 RepID=A0A5C5VRJ7_9PLAN|nr:sigma-70 family RNA polymerase sigma factor [Thalassoglobus neptunius]TWT40192.1 hypothetical protein KOR42_49340 [Thalassoglobus neptunius]
MRKTRAQEAIVSNYARTLIPFKARQLCRKAGFTPSDQEDIEQQLWMAVLAQVDNYNPERASLDTMIDCIVDSSARMILRERRTRRRTNSTPVESIDLPICCEEDLESTLADCLHAGDRVRHRGAFSRDEQLLDETREAVEQALQNTPTGVRDVCRRVMGGSILGTSKALGISRRQVRKRLAEAKEAFENSGFGNS